VRRRTLASTISRAVRGWGVFEKSSSIGRETSKKGKKIAYFFLTQRGGEDDKVVKNA